MKRSKLFILIVVFLMTLTSCLDSSLFYEQTGFENPTVYCNTISKKAFIGDYIWDGDLNNTIINIPEEYEGCRVTSLGGYYGSGAPIPFTVFCDNHSQYLDDVSNINNVIEVQFTINLTKYIEKVRTTPTLDEYYIDSDNNIYHYTYYYNCPSDNEVFYSVDGKLYNKEDNKK